MSLSHPYLKQLKVHILRFCQSGTSIPDEHPSVLPFCKTLEDALEFGLLPRTLSNSLRTGLAVRCYWQWIQSLANVFPMEKLTVPLQFCISFVQKCKQVTTDRGRGRLCLRLLINKRLLTHTMRLMRSNKEILMEYYEDLSILGDDILSEIMLSMLEPLSQCRFAFNIKNASFLDDSWEIPIHHQYELVPCKVLGVQLEEVGSRIMVNSVQPGSVADEELKIEPGDVIDEVFGESLRNCSKRKFGRLMATYQGSPIYISVIKCCYNDGTIYRPLWPYIDEIGLNRSNLSTAHRVRMVELGQEKMPSCKGIESSKLITPTGEYPVKYLGFVGVGTVGTVEFIEDAVESILKTSTLRRDILLKLCDTEVTCTCPETDVMVLQHGFPEIASCGRRVDYPLNFAYIAGDTTCTIAKQFFCHVFEATADEQAKAILHSIAQGFNRTHWAV